jgi:hypothetical protein
MIYLYAAARRNPGDGWPSRIEDDSPVQMAECGGWWLIFSEVPGWETLDLDTCVRTIEWLAPRALRHEAVVEAAHERAAIVPARFATLFAGWPELLQWLDLNTASLSALLDRVDGCDEWGVRVEVEAGLAADRAVECAGLDQLPAGRRYLEQARIRRDAARFVEREAAAQSTRLIDRLRQSAKDLTSRSVRESAFLVPRELRQTFPLLAEEFHRPDLGLQFVVTGPWPPYSFVRSATPESPVASGMAVAARPVELTAPPAAQTLAAAAVPGRSGGALSAPPRFV